MSVDGPVPQKWKVSLSSLEPYCFFSPRQSTLTNKSVLFWGFFHFFGWHWLLIQHVRSVWLNAIAYHTQLFRFRLQQWVNVYWEKPILHTTEVHRKMGCAYLYSYSELICVATYCITCNVNRNHIPFMTFKSFTYTSKRESAENVVIGWLSFLSPGQ